MKPMKNVALAAEYEHPAEMEKRLEEDRVTDALVDKQKREREQLKDKHDREKDRDRLRLTRLKNVQTGQQDEGKGVNRVQQAAIAIAKKKSGKYDKDGNKKENVSDAVLATKKRFIKTLRKRKITSKKNMVIKQKKSCMELL